ncbi:HNH endonuclease signature motif containing protein [Succinivibrio dextrinosolvens]|uniref:HNH endonuclease signature motif containing protein n=1 Tax=Succinivibrio dextrinosolvens TaxID=83771 RepID=UPI001920B61A|nr:HNH endonuclease signature motif containing protein [Succinivibrio dextrinosolvens]
MGLFGIIKTGFILSKVAVKSSVYITKGAVNTARDVGRLGNAVVKGDVERACDILEDRVTKSIVGLGNTLESTAYVTGHALDKISGESKTPFLDKETQKHLVRLTSIAAVGAVAANVLDDDDNDEDNDVVNRQDHSFHVFGDGLVPDSDLPGIENGVFVGDYADLNDLIKAGEIDGTTHIDDDDYVRDMTARNAFLKMHGLDSVPEGYEVHHIIPLCEGGADSPENMVLIKESQHDLITRAHAEFYGWFSNK